MRKLGRHNKRVLIFRKRNGQFASRKYARRYPKSVRRSFQIYSIKTRRFVSAAKVSRRSDVQILRELYAQDFKLKSGKIIHKALTAKGASAQVLELQAAKEYSLDEFEVRNYLRWYEFLIDHVETSHLAGKEIRKYVEYRHKQAALAKEYGIGGTE